MSKEVRKAIDQLTAEKGEKRNSVWYAKFTVKEVLDKASLKNTPDFQRHVIYILRQWYPETSVSPGQGDNGGFINMKVRGI